jgi:CRP-like cAMP-binding protein
MQVRPELAVLGVSDPTRLDPYLERRRYRPGERLMAQGSSGDECYLIVSGEVRLEVERPDFDSDGVIAYLGTARRPTAASASATA